MALSVESCVIGLLIWTAVAANRTIGGGHVLTVLALILFAGNGGLSSLITGQTAKPNHNPQPSFSLRVRALQDAVKLGSPVSIEVTKKDISDHEINNATIRGTLPYEIKVRDDQGNLRPETEEFRQIKKSKNDRSFSVTFANLKPGETARDMVDMNKYYDFSQAGKYTIQVSETDPESKIIVKLNTISVTVIP
jgi:hypothetical protein